MLEKIQKLDINEEKIIASLTILVLNQVLQRIVEVAFLEEGALKNKRLNLEILKAEKVNNPEYYLHQDRYATIP